MPIPPLLNKLITSTFTSKELDTLAKDVLDQTESVITSDKPHPFTTLIQLRPSPNLLQKVDMILSKVHHESTIHALLKQFKQDYEILRELETLLAKPHNSLQHPTLLRFMIKIHHALLQHLLRAIYLIDHYDETTEHDLLTLIGMCSWKTPLPAELKDKTLQFYDNIHHLSSYPFNTNKVYGPLHQLILEAEIYWDHPDLKIDQAHGFEVVDFSFGLLKVSLKNPNAEELLQQSRNLVNQLSELFLYELKSHLE